MLHPGGNRMETLKKYELFHADLIEKLKGGVVSVGVSVYPSYSKLKHKVNFLSCLSCHFLFLLLLFSYPS